MIVLDTCTLLWLVAEPERLSQAAVSALRRHEASLAVVSISAWEIAVKAGAGKLGLPPGISPAEWFGQARAEYGLHELPLDSAVLCRTAALPPIHRDPCDRFIIAAALYHHAPVVTADPLFAAYPDLTVIW